MDLLNSPVSEVWKATKRVFTDVVDDRSRPTTDISSESDRGSAGGRSGGSSRQVTSNNSSKGPKNKVTMNSTPKKQGKTRTISERELQSVAASGPFVSGNLKINYSDDLTDDDYDFPSTTTMSQQNKKSAVTANRYHTLDPKMHSLRGRYTNDLDSEHLRPMEASQRSLPPASESSRSRTPKTSNSRSRTRSKSSDRMYNRIDQDAMFLWRRRSLSTDDDLQEEQGEKVKTKLMTMWNNMKYGWTVKMKTNFNYQKPVWFLGFCYHQRPEDPDPNTEDQNQNNGKPGQMELFKRDFTSRIWLTYRREFPVLAGSSFTTDCGWGCMLRSGQMMLAQSLVLHFLGRDWNIYKDQSEVMMVHHYQIIRWFGDQPSEMSPFSVHRLVDIGQTSGKKAGDWYGPASVAHILKEAVDIAPELHPLLEQICIYVGQDCTVYKQDVIDICTSRQKSSLQPVYQVPTANKKSTKDENGRSKTTSHKTASQQMHNKNFTNYNDRNVYKKHHNELYKLQNHNVSYSDGASSSRSHSTENNQNGSGHYNNGDLECDSAIESSNDLEEVAPWTAVVLLVPVRLGGEVVNPIYLRGIQSLFTMENCLGIIGGKPKHSLYFVGFQEEKLIHLDPHFCQGMVDMKNHQFPLHSFHCMSPRKMSISKMDPSCTIGFYCKTRQDFEDFCRIIPEVVTPPKHEGDYPMFIVRDGRCEDWNAKAKAVTNKPEKYLRVRHVDEKGRVISPVRESEDFVFLET
ncbi:cysteine protease ATG4D-like isoform X2 [Antedon mediterranea]|uniref:cysteine protease ATG4D-like isoform X2 n=1 Tax=Antedon mediterranea TaxID=105859 RepID=UPI003AF4AD8D